MPIARRPSLFRLVFVASVAGCGGFLGFGDDDAPRPEGDVGRSDDDGGLEGGADETATGEGGAGGGDGAPSPKRVFVTSERFTGDFGGRAAADALCARAATAAGRPGTFLAYLAEEDGGHPSLRFPVDQRWALLDPEASVAFARSPQRQAAPEHPIAIDEHGAAVPVDGSERYVWTGVVTPPSYPGEQTCDGWTATSGMFAGYGDLTSTSSNWQEQPATASECLQAYRLYRFER